MWHGRQVLNVHFMNPDDIDNKFEWHCRRKTMNVNTIFAWARVWNYVGLPMIPVLKYTERADRADIRVKFSGNNSSLACTQTLSCTK